MEGIRGLKLTTEAVASAVSTGLESSIRGVSQSAQKQGISSLQDQKQVFENLLASLPTPEDLAKSFIASPGSLQEPDQYFSDQLNTGGEITGLADGSAVLKQLEEQNPDISGGINDFLDILRNMTAQFADELSSDNANTIGGALGDVFNTVGGALGSSADTISGALDEVANTIGGALRDVLNPSKAANTIGGALGDTSVVFAGRRGDRVLPAEVTDALFSKDILLRMQETLTEISSNLSIIESQRNL